MEALMKLRIYSDLHNEFHLFDPPPLNPSVDLVILAGDIDKKARGVKWANETFTCPTVYVSGNHEFYDGHIDRTLQKMKETAEAHVHILENQSFIIGNTRILGTAAWTDFSSTGDQVAAAALARASMNDFRYIRADAGYRRLRPDDLIARNHTAKTWLNHQLAQPFEGKTIVVTHHAPSPAVVGNKHEGHLNAAYTNDWPGLIQQADLWIFGHTHDAVDVELAGCRVVSNPRGYPDERTGFNASLEIEV
jgi:predicted phosphodiesterase